MTFRFGGYQGPASIHNRAAQTFGAALSRRLGPSAAFELVGNVLDLGRNSSELPAMVEQGELDFCYISSVQFTRLVPELQILELPFVIRDRPTILRALAGPLGARFTRRMREATPFRVLGYWDNGFRHVSAVKPLRTPADCRGLTIRTQVSELHVACFRLLGFEPLPVDVKVFVDEIDRQVSGAGQSAHQHLQLRRASLSPVHHAQQPSVGRGVVHLPRGGLCGVARGRARRGGCGGA